MEHRPIRPRDFKGSEEGGKGGRRERRICLPRREDICQFGKKGFAEISSQYAWETFLGQDDVHDYCDRSCDFLAPFPSFVGDEIIASTIIGAEVGLSKNGKCDGGKMSFSDFALTIIFKKFDLPSKHFPMQKM